MKAFQKHTPYQIPTCTKFAVVKRLLIPLLTAVGILNALYAGTPESEKRSWSITYKILGVAKTVTFEATVVSYDGFDEVRAVTGEGKRMYFKYGACSAADQGYLDSLDAPLNAEAGVSEKPQTEWFYPQKKADGKRIKWAKGTFKQGRKDGLWLRWWPNQSMQSRGQYLAGQKVGLWEYFKEDGSTDYTEQWSLPDASQPKDAQATILLETTRGD